MAKRRKKRAAQKVPKSKSPLEQIARDSVTSETRHRNAYKMVRFAEKDFEGGVSLNGMRLERLACVKALEGLARKHPKRKTLFLQAYHLMAATQYHGDILAAQGHRDGTYRERIDVSSRSEGGLSQRLDVSRRLLRAAEALEPEELACLNAIIRDKPEATMVDLWPNRTQRNTARELIKSGLHELAVFYGIARF